LRRRGPAGTKTRRENLGLMFSGKLHYTTNHAGVRSSGSVEKGDSQVMGQILASHASDVNSRQSRPKKERARAGKGLRGGTFVGIKHITK